MTDVLKVTATGPAATARMFIQCKPDSYSRRQNRTARITSRRALLRKLSLP
jgi:hypothetical protein